ncbi:hypothetical protein N7452_001467 [Penicillium brevicompactum]|uniref:Uncharacterized protein n=1 Tax=Penicillium brevicompactum TaxID=5074 RepID=A0A9W9UP90_PENBR|nr:hypothetical protein N7452_001467 [Penicillium brevicompactum]
MAPFRSGQPGFFYINRYQPIYKVGKFDPVKNASVNDPASYIVQQRRELVKRWAEADQSFHDSYHTRALLKSPLEGNPYPVEATTDSSTIPNYAIAVLPPVDSSHPIYHNHWIEYLLLFNRFDGAREKWMAEDDSHALIFAGESSAPPMDKHSVSYGSFG